MSMSEYLFEIPSGTCSAENRNKLRSEEGSLYQSPPPRYLIRAISMSLDFDCANADGLIRKSNAVTSENMVKNDLCI